jgi:L-seryl-tRNA(Ser) seleniumtransferase
MTTMHQLSRLPSVSRLLSDTRVADLVDSHGHTAITQLIRKVLDEVRATVRTGAPLPQLSELIERVTVAANAFALPGLRPVYNLTGTVLHTNLGRASLPEEAITALVAAARNSCALEYDINNGCRGDRDDIVSDLLCELTGAEAATVVNNNAAAVFLLLNTLAKKRKVIVSRGELIEIGGAFRIPDIMKSAGAKLVEVGTTNRTHLKDFREAITSRTAMLMKIHASNYAIRGFTHAVPENELARLAHDNDLPFVVDLGSGTLTDLDHWGLPHEPTPRESIAAGADLVTFSGDKLLGGPQAGLLVGRSDLITKIKQNPLKRALRVGKITLAALEAVLRLYRNPEHLQERLTVLQQLTRPATEIRSVAERLLPALQAALEFLPVTVEVVSLNSQIGSGSLPVDRLPSAGLAIRPQGKKSGILNRIEIMLREMQRPVIGRIDSGALLLDMRCLAPAEEIDFIEQFKTLGQLDVQSAG